MTDQEIWAMLRRGGLSVEASAADAKEGEPVLVGRYHGMVDPAIVDQLGFANSGSEATQPAMRLARGDTGKDKVPKREGSYNGFLDCHAFSHIAALAAAGTEQYPVTLPSSAGVPKAVQDTVIVAASTILTARRRSSSATLTSSPPSSPRPSSPTAASSRPNPAFSRVCAAAATSTAYC